MAGLKKRLQAFLMGVPLDQLLNALDPDRDKAGEKYQILHNKLIAFFNRKTDLFPPDFLADETLDRVAEKVDQGTEIRDISAYSLGVARFILLEKLRQPKIDSIDDEKQRKKLKQLDESKSSEELECLKKCLGELNAQDQELLLDYFDQGTDEKAKDQRLKIAQTFSMSSNTLRIKICRLKIKLEECIKRCLEQNQILQMGRI